MAKNCFVSRNGGKWFFFGSSKTALSNFLAVQLDFSDFKKSEREIKPRTEKIFDDFDSGGAWHRYGWNQAVF